VAAVVAIGRSDAVTEAPPGPLPRGSRRTMIGVGMLGLTAFVGLPMVSAIDLTRRLAAGEAAVYEGPVTFESLGKTECLTVAGYRDCYGEAEVIPGWNRQRYLVGGLDSGAQLRISVLDDMIVRLELADPAQPTSYSSKSSQPPLSLGMKNALSG